MDSLQEILIQSQELMKMDSVPMFDGNHYECWSVKMKTLLKAIDLWDVVETGVLLEPLDEASSTSHEFEDECNASSVASSLEHSNWMEMKDMTALYIIQSGLSSEVLPWIVSATSSKEAWELLLVRSLGGPLFQARKLLDLKEEYDNMTMSDVETIHEFTEKLMKLVFHMKSCGWEVEDKEVVEKILYSLPPRFDGVMVDIVKTSSASVLIDWLLVHEYNMNSLQECSEESLDDEAESLVDWGYVASMFSVLMFCICMLCVLD